MTLELADAAKAKGLDKDPLLARRVELEQDKILAETYINSVEAAARSEFDAKGPSLDAAAREAYLVNKAKYTKPETVMISQLAFRFDGAPEPPRHGPTTRTRRSRPAPTSAISSRSPPTRCRRQAARQQGPLARKDLDPELVALVFETAKVGEVNPPVRTAKNWAIVRVNERIPGSTQSFEQARKSIIEPMRTSTSSTRATRRWPSSAAARSPS